VALLTLAVFGLAYLLSAGFTDFRWYRKYKGGKWERWPVRFDGIALTFWIPVKDWTPAGEYPYVHCYGTPILEEDGVPLVIRFKRPR
jgi:hypothetical protein